MKYLKKYRSLLITSALILLFAILLIGLGDAIVPLIISFGFAYLLFPVIQKIEKQGVPRKYAVLGSALIFIFLISILFFLFLPGLLAEFKNFANELPQNVEKATKKVEHLLSYLGLETLLSRIGIPVDRSQMEIKNFFIEKAFSFSDEILKFFSSFFKGLFSSLLDWILMILNIFLIPLFFFYIINDYEKITKELKSFIPISFRNFLKPYIKECNLIFSSYIRGQLVAVFLLGILYGIGLSIVSLRFGFLIGMLTGILNIIPFLGVILGLLLALIIYLAYFTGIQTLIGILIVFAVVKLIDDFIITPKLVGERVGLSAFLTVLALIIGGNLLGFVGMILAIPTAAFLKFVILNLKNQRSA